MSRDLKYPLIDERRGKQLRADLLRNIAALAPDWRAVENPSGHDRALIEIAARLFEHATQRLDKMPGRDALAFLDMFDIPGPKPSSADGYAIFALAENATGTEMIGPRAGLDVPNEAGEDARFETTEALPIHAARVKVLATVEPSTDRIGMAPAAVSALEPDELPTLNYRLAATSGPEDTVIRLDMSTGLEPGHLLRIENLATHVVRIRTISEVGEDGLVSLTEAVGGEGALIEDNYLIQRMTWLDAFSMPDGQEHALYLGDNALLDVKEPATFHLTVQGDPEGFAASDIEVEIFGKRDMDPADDPPKWHRLPLVSSTNGVFSYFKAWTGSVEGLEIAPDVEARWLRIRRKGPILPVAPISESADLSVDRILVQVETDKPENEVGAVAVSQASHNGTPLPVTSVFMPFGPEPQRFDVFGIAAPETFSKAGALATLSFELLNATISTLSSAVRRDTKRHVYGVGANGRLQVIDLEEDPQFWREVGGPENDGEAMKFLSGAKISAAQCGNFSDMVTVLARGQGGAPELRSARIHKNTDDELVVKPWYPVPAIPGVSDISSSAAYAMVPIWNGGDTRSQLISISNTGVRRIIYRADGSPSSVNWLDLPVQGLAPDLDETARLCAIPGSFTTDLGDLLATDKDGHLWLLRFLAGGVVRWMPLSDLAGDPFGADTGTQPTAIVWANGDGDRRFAVAANVGGSHFRYIEYDDTFASPMPLSEISEPVPAESSLLLTNGVNTPDHIVELLQTPPGAIPADKVNRPTLLVASKAGNAPLVDEWVMDDPPVRFRKAVPMTMPLGPATSLFAAALAADQNHPAQLLLAGKDETLVKMDLTAAHPIRLSSWIGTTEDPDNFNKLVLDYIADTDSGPVQRILDLKQDLDPVATSLVPATSYFAIPEKFDESKDIVIWRAGPGDNVTYRSNGTTLPGRPRLEYGDTSLLTPAALPGRKIVVTRVGAPSIQAVFEIEQAINTDPGGSDTQNLFVTDDTGLINFATIDGTSLDVRIFGGDLGDVSRVSAGDTDHYGTLALVAGTGATINGIVLPGTENQSFDFIGPDLSTVASGLVAGLLPAWSGQIPDATRAKIVSDTVEIQAFVADPLERNYQGPELSWEYFNGDGWKRLDHKFDDTTDNLARSGEISFTVPDDISMVDIGGQEDLWVRARLIGGDYGRARYVVDTTVDNNGHPTSQAVTVDTDHMRPPEVSAVSSYFSATPLNPPARVIARNNVRDIDQTAANTLGGASYSAFEGAHQTVLSTGSDHRPALMIGLSQTIESNIATLYADISDAEGDPVIKVQTLGADLSWSDAPLVGRDETNGFTQSGLVRFDIEGDLTPANLFGQNLCWMRILGKGQSWRPRIHGLWLNGVPIVQAETINQELLGASLGEPDTTFQLLKTPVLENSLELRVRERLSIEDVEELRENTDPNGPDPVLDDVENIPGQWVLWKRVDSLSGREGERVFLLSSQGEIQFGNGSSGRIPPAERDGIRAFTYQAGGLEVQSPTRSPLKPKDQIPGFEIAFTPKDIAGGSAPIGNDGLLRRMPQVLRHQNKALSLTDIEHVARDVDADIVHCSALQPALPGGKIRLFVLAKGEGRQPVYGKAKRMALASAIAARSSDAYSSECLNVQSVRFVECALSAVLVAKPGHELDVNAAARSRLFNLFDPVTGGPKGEGWRPARAPVALDVERTLKGMNGLESVASVAFSKPNGEPIGVLEPDQVVTIVEPAQIDLDVSSEVSA